MVLVFLTDSPLKISYRINNKIVELISNIDAPMQEELEKKVSYKDFHELHSRLLVKIRKILIPNRYYIRNGMRIYCVENVKSH